MKNYEELYENIVNNNNIPDKIKSKLLIMLDMVESIDNDSEKMELEDRVFTINNNWILSEKERIYYSLKQLYNTGNYDEYEKTNKINYVMNNQLSNKQIVDIKKYITKEQINNDIKPTFYSVFSEVLNEYIDTYMKSSNILKHI